MITQEDLRAAYMAGSDASFRATDETFDQWYQDKFKDSVPLVHLGLSPRVRNALIRGKIKNVSDLRPLLPNENGVWPDPCVLDVRGFGMDAYKELRYALDAWDKEQADAEAPV